MAEELKITDQLKTQFAQLGQIQSVAERLRERLDTIAAENHRYGGTDDEYAQAYYKNVDTSTQDLHDLVDGIGELFDTTGANGQAVDSAFDEVNDASTQVSARKL